MWAEYTSHPAYRLPDPVPGTLRRRCHDLSALIALQGPTLLVDQAMVWAAQQDKIPERGLTAVSPVHEVVTVGPRGRSIAAGEAAAAVAHHKGTPDAGRHGSRRSPDRQGHPVIPQLDCRAHGVTPQAPRHVVDDRPSPLELRRQRAILAAERSR
jgi:hypothetical protein